MTHLAQDELATIEQNPLGDSLDRARKAFRDAELGAGKGVRSDALFVAAVGKLFSDLSASDAPLQIASRTGRDSLCVDLGAIRWRLQKGDIEHKLVRPVSKLVIKKAPDVDIWIAVIELVRAIFQATPSPSPPSSFYSPIAHSSAVLEEIRHCTHRAVKGFHKKYFEDKRWNRRVRRVWNTARRLYINSEKRWKGIPSAATADEVCGWLLNLQQELLANERAAYFRSSANNRVGAEARRQLDLLVRLKSHNSSDVSHNWEDVLVVGELKESDQKTKELWLQIGTAVRNVFASQPRRRFVHAFTLTGTEMENWVFDRSGPYSGSVFDIHQEPEMFAQVLCGYLMMTDDELGLDTFCQQNKSKLTVTLPRAPRGRKRKLELDSTPISYQRAIVCRGTSCFLAKPADTEKYGGVVKFSWTSSLRPPEANLLQKAHERGVKGLAKLIGYHEEITSISKLREGLVFSTPHKFGGVPRGATSSFSQSQIPQSHSFSRFPRLSMASSSSKRKPVDGDSHGSKRSRSNSQLAGIERDENAVSYHAVEPQGTSLVQQDQTPFENRILRALAISPAGRSVAQFRSITELLQCLRDAIKAHRSLFVKGKILHRDISENNIIITHPEKADGYKGMLIDLDLAKEEEKGPSGACHRTGTIQFMAIEVLLGASHTYRHDLEAFLYVLIWLCFRRGEAVVGKPKVRTERMPLSHWYTRSFTDIARIKRGEMDKRGFEWILKDFPEAFESIKPLCRTIRDVLFPYQDGLFTGTPQDPHVLYDPIIKAFDQELMEADAK